MYLKMNFGIAKRDFIAANLRKNMSCREVFISSNNIWRNKG
jgi:hypothetical protein